ncbi:hypothetical protein I7I50_11651 [Histoplasma capsulatum G186AR]|uniref:Uncharacterized protein n=1 Tax=Ajellomyces capsulatus TaxID=5037 RepID=A0A8H7Z5J3_AJECA|nr:hypothetical protein I7I52_02888 [Histoplasma capsulatum]QSS70123.1 hypothetical protein I7I50_11651 [Histoplasma capsulatum G186AR]
MPITLMLQRLKHHVADLDIIYKICLVISSNSISEIFHFHFFIEIILYPLTSSTIIVFVVLPTSILSKNIP